VLPLTRQQSGNKKSDSPNFIDNTSNTNTTSQMAQTNLFRKRFAKASGNK